MPYRSFLIPLADTGPAAEELNAFLRRVQVVSVEKHLLPERGVWAFCVEYVDGPSPSGQARQATTKVDYRSVLPPEVFAVYAELRDLRKVLAEGAGVPVYAVFTNQQLAAIAQQRPASLAALRNIEGLGPAKAEAYGQAILDRLRQLPVPPSEEPAPCDAS